MDAANQQKILGYFIEEAKEHLQTLEEGILELSTVVNDAERVNEMFRAAHSVKGGAAMLGYTTIQKTAHRLEDAFKILKENRISADQKLESLFLESYDVLQDLLKRLESPQGLHKDEGETVLKTAEPSFVNLQNYLNELLADGTQDAEVTPAVPKSTANPGEQVKKILLQMLALFKQKASPESRQKLVQLCQSLTTIFPEQSAWKTLVASAQKAVANPKHSYRTLAPVVLKELKQAGDLLAVNPDKKIALSSNLQQLADTNLPQILITLEPQAAAKALINAFNKQQLSQVIEILRTNV